MILTVFLPRVHVGFNEMVFWKKGGKRKLITKVGGIVKSLQVSFLSNKIKADTDGLTG